MFTSDRDEDEEGGGNVFDCCCCCDACMGDLPTNVTPTGFTEGRLVDWMEGEEEGEDEEEEGGGNVGVNCVPSVVLFCILLFFPLYSSKVFHHIKENSI